MWQDVFLVEPDGRKILVRLWRRAGTGSSPPTPPLKKRVLRVRLVLCRVWVHNLAVSILIPVL